MTPGTEPMPQVIFGLDPMWFAGGLFFLTYILIMTERVNRAIVAMAAAARDDVTNCNTCPADSEALQSKRHALATGHR